MARWPRPRGTRRFGYDENAHMRATYALILALELSACGGGSPTASPPTVPTPTPRAGYTGEWNGATLTGERIAFTVSAEQKVTALSIDYRFGGCSGSRTFSGLSLEIGTASGTSPFFQHRIADTGSRNFIAVDGFFDSSQVARGLLGFSDFMDCGDSLSLWNASRR